MNTTASALTLACREVLTTLSHGGWSAATVDPEALRHLKRRKLVTTSKGLNKLTRTGLGVFADDFNA